MSRRRAVLVRTTMTQLTPNRAKNFLQFKMPLCIFWQSLKTPEIYSSSLTKVSPISLHRGCFSPRTMSSTLRSSWGGGGGGADRNPPGQWRDVAAPHPTALSIFTPDICPRRPGITSSGPWLRQEQRCPPSKRGTPPGRSPRVHQ